MKDITADEIAPDDPINLMPPLPKVAALGLQHVMVMYAGQVVEHPPAEQLLQNPKHPYTIGLMNSVPDITQTVGRLHAMDGLVPDLYHMPEGCRFAPRCDKRCEACLQGEIPLSVLPDGRQVRCVQYGK